jgi:hypothetical protein
MFDAPAAYFSTRRAPFLCLGRTSHPLTDRLRSASNLHPATDMILFSGLIALGFAKTGSHPSEAHLAVVMSQAAVF